MSHLIFESPVDLVKHLYAGENTLTGICRAPSALFGWYTRAKRVYDSSLCGSCKGKITREAVEQEYVQIVNYSSTEKINAVLAVGSEFTLKLDGKTLGRVQIREQK